MHAHVLEHLLDPKTRQLRRLRLDAEAAGAAYRKAHPPAPPRVDVNGTAQDFWDRVDTSDGMDACHPWKGHVNTTWSKDYDVGEFRLAGCATKLAHRIVLFLTYGREVHRDHDVVPTHCGDRLCCNEKHLQVQIGRGKRKRMLDAAEYFRRAAPGSVLTTY